jgi:hypothetical protein
MLSVVSEVGAGVGAGVGTVATAKVGIGFGVVSTPIVTSTGVAVMIEEGKGEVMGVAALAIGAAVGLLVKGAGILLYDKDRDSDNSKVNERLKSSCGDSSIGMLLSKIPMSSRKALRMYREGTQAVCESATLFTVAATTI